MSSEAGDSYQDAAELEEAQSQLAEIEMELQRLSLSAVDPAVRESLMGKLRQVRMDLFERQAEIDPDQAVPPTRLTFKAPHPGTRSTQRAQSAGNGTRFGNRSRNERAAAGPKKRAQSAGLRSSVGGRSQPQAQTKKTRKTKGGRKPIVLDMMKFVDTTRPPTASSRRSGDARNRIVNAAFSAIPAGRPGPGPAEYYPDDRKRATTKRAPSASFSREDRLKHLAGETSADATGRLGPGPKYKPSVVQTKKRHSVVAIGRENRLGSSVGS